MLGTTGLREDGATAEARWELFHDNRSGWRAVFETCEAATQSLDLEQYIFRSDGVGGRLLELLTAKARQGVAVRVVADGIGGFSLSRSEGARSLVRAGGEIALYNGLADIARKPARIVHRLHRKTVLCDRRLLIVGGYCYSDRMSDWRDTMIRIEDRIPDAVPIAFEAVLHAAQRRSAERPRPSGRSDGDGWSYRLSGPCSEAAPGLREALLHHIASARRSLTLITPYLIPDRPLWRALLAARDAGACVRILMPARSDHPSLDLVSRPFVRALSRRGVEVYGYEPTMLHAKIALADNDWCAVSSFNLDLLSLRMNLENGVVSRSSALYGALAEQAGRYFHHARRL